MNLRLLANSVTQNVNPNQDATLISNSGYVTDDAGKRTPVTTSTTVRIQAQAVDQGLLEHTDALNLQGTLRSVYIYEQGQGVVRVTAQGGDILQFPLTFGGANRDWLIAHIMEDWHSSGNNWSHVIVVLQA